MRFASHLVHVQATISQFDHDLLSIFLKKFPFLLRTLLFLRCSLKNGKLHDKFEHSALLPIFKDGEMEVFSCYQATFWKVNWFEALACYQKHSTFNLNQSAYRSFNPTGTALLTVNSKRLCGLKKKQTFLLILLTYLLFSTQLIVSFCGTFFFLFRSNWQNFNPFTTLSQKPDWMCDDWLLPFLTKYWLAKIHLRPQFWGHFRLFLPVASI